ncbi:MAG: YkgJ family cysteine cluster protein [Methanospirillum sp.]|uniref:YkgJ family cysteine cluster protein n=1 Tax=Methanospirillum sp. TaxID=45200 RepID=UPI002370CD6B|nr:YkgJ family cysteine cluster protein [Methanospirillum sp.]MDD1729695.1 YkgJ family cysteine cluster protein [Methanospirillum sp.]
MSDSFLKGEHSRFTKELELLHAYPIKELAEIIREVGFFCTRCGSCCVTSQNGHVFLLDDDTRRAKEICPEAIIPAPFFEVCDRSGNFYVSGYALRTNPDGTCIHLTDNTCKIYSDRFSICRVYPYMLHREPDENGILSFRQISGLNEHGEYNTPISEEDSLTLASETVAYEERWLNQMIGFYKTLITRFDQSGEKHVRKIYDQQMRAFTKGEMIRVFVYFEGEFSPHTVTITEYGGIII